MSTCLQVYISCFVHVISDSRLPRSSKPRYPAYFQFTSGGSREPGTRLKSEGVSKDDDDDEREIHRSEREIVWVGGRERGSEGGREGGREGRGRSKVQREGEREEGGRCSGREREREERRELGAGFRGRERKREVGVEEEKRTSE